MHHPIEIAYNWLAMGSTIRTERECMETIESGWSDSSYLQYFEQNLRKSYEDNFPLFAVEQVYKIPSGEDAKLFLFEQAYKNLSGEVAILAVSKQAMHIVTFAKSLTGRIVNTKERIIIEYDKILNVEMTYKDQVQFMICSLESSDARYISFQFSSPEKAVHLMNICQEEKIAAEHSAEERYEEEIRRISETKFVVIRSYLSSEAFEKDANLFVKYGFTIKSLVGGGQSGGGQVLNPGGAALGLFLLGPIGGVLMSTKEDPIKSNPFTVVYERINPKVD